MGLIFNNDNPFAPGNEGLTPEEIELRNSQQQQDATSQVLDLLFGRQSAPGEPEMLQAAVPSPRNIIPTILKFARGANLGAGKQLSKLPGAVGNLFKSGGKAVQNPVSGKFTPNASITQGVKSAAKGAANLAAKPVKLAGDMGKAAINNPLKSAGIVGGVAATGIIPGAENVVKTGVGVARGLGDRLFGSKEDPEATEERANAAADIPGIPSPRQEVVNEVSTRSGASILPEGPSDRRARELEGFEARRQAQADVSVRQAAGVGRLENQEQSIADERQNIAEQIAGLRQAPANVGQNEFGSRLASLLAIGLPSALAGSQQGVNAAISTSQGIARSAAQGRAQQAEQIKALQGRADKLLNVQISATKGVIEGQGKIGAQLSKESAAFKENVEQTRKLEDEGRLSKAQRREVGDTRYDNQGISIGDKSVYRAAGAPKMSTQDQNRLSGIVNTQPIIKNNLKTLQRIIDEVGVTGDAAFSEPVTIIDPKTGKEKTFRNAAGAMETLSTLFKANVKDIENLGALGQDVLDFTSRLIDDPTGYLDSIKDFSAQGGQAEKISQQVDVMIDNYDSQKDNFFQAHQIKTDSELNSELLDRGEVQGFSRLAPEQSIPGHPERTIKMVDPEDGKVFILTPEEYDQVIRNNLNSNRR